MQGENDGTADLKFDFSGKTVFVTGASRGIGREIREMGAQVTCLALDQRDTSAIRAQIAPLGPIDVLVNNAGVEEVRATLDVDEALWDKIVDTNLKGAFFVAQAVAAQMAEAGRGAISKSGILGMTRAMAAEWAPKGIRVNAIAPGYFETDMTSVFYEDKDWVARMVGSIPAGRLGDLADLTGAVRFLASSGANYIAGQCVVIDGGYLANI